MQYALCTLHTFYSSSFPFFSIYCLEGGKKVQFFFDSLPQSYAEKPTHIWGLWDERTNQFALALLYGPENNRHNSQYRTH